VTYRLVVHPRVASDTNKVREWYGEISPRLFNEFSGQLESLLDRIIAFPASYAEVRAGFRRASLVRFPFQVFYQITGDRVWVLGVTHSHADPAATLRRVMGRSSGPAPQ
jgi:plasmid stabilization system protein ParE